MKPVPREALDVFLRDFALTLTLRCGQEFDNKGRGAMLVGFNLRAEPFVSATYVTWADAKRQRFSAEFIQAVETYDPRHEAILFLNCGDRARLLRLSLESGSDPDGFCKN